MGDLTASLIWISAAPENVKIDVNATIAAMIKLKTELRIKSAAFAKDIVGKILVDISSNSAMISEGISSLVETNNKN